MGVSNRLSSTSACVVLVVLAFGSFGPCNAHITYMEPRNPLKGSPPPPGSPWPMPQSYAASPNLYELRPDSFHFNSNIDDCDIISKAFVRYRKLIFIQESVPSPSCHPRLRSLNVDLTEKADCTYPQHGMDESYALTIDSKLRQATLRSNSPWGVLRGLETFSQLVYIDENTNHYFINESSVWDWPRFGFRGIHLDTARHFLPMKTLKRNLEAMSYNKFNVFHWHIVDDQSWPYQMKVFPNLTNSAYHPKLIYSQENVQEIIEFARERGIRVIPEVDTPGHSQALGKVFPDILTACYNPNGREGSRYPHFSAHEILDPTQDNTYNVVKKILQEVNATFPDNYMHLGMDEVYYDCWQSNPEIGKFMKAHNMTSASRLEQFYVKRTLDNVKAFGAKYMIWQDPLDNNVRPAPDTIIEVWRSTNGTWRRNLEQAVRHGYQVVLSAPWYLNYIQYGADWVKYYTVNPTDFKATDEEKKLVIGGEACMWGEFVDATNVISRYWPRASSVAERLWSASYVNDPEEAKWRLDEQRCRMIRRGIPAEPIMNGYCGSYDWDM
ncbi:beta-hexosaminidase subunit beta-like [Varroa destructor]|uniref:Beta-hexosaminidase n=1 Tax=Varroa destructor TaxID=109461 RepID=A0A7M7JSE7_VARDE|nr:beta-hexosaminidase subunit beta-like [Varroa destructor]